MPITDEEEMREFRNQVAAKLRLALDALENDRPVAIAFGFTLGKGEQEQVQLGCYWNTSDSPRSALAASAVALEAATVLRETTVDAISEAAKEGPVLGRVK